MELSLLATKLLTIFGMLLVGLLPGLIPVVVPLWFQKKQAETVLNSKSNRQMHLSSRGKKIVSALACFGAGVFIATFFLDMLGEVRTAWDDWYKAAGMQPDYPWPELFAILGFLLVMMVEQITMFFHSRRQIRSGEQPVHEQSVRVQHVNDEHAIVVLSNSPPSPPSPPSAPKSVYSGVIPLTPVDIQSMPSKNADGVNTVNEIPESHVVNIEKRKSSQRRRGSNCSTASGIVCREAAAKVRAEPHDVSIADIHIEPSSDLAQGHINLKSVMRALILLLALCFHSLFEGMAIGLMKDHKETLTLFFSVCLHKGVVAFCLGLNISQSGLRPFLVTIFIVLFASMSPLGIALGLAISQAPATLTRYAVIAILQGLSSGTFLYVTFIEILPKELLKDEMTHGGGGEHHDHSNIFLEDIKQTTVSKETATTTILSCDEASALNRDHSRRARRHHAADADSNHEADKLIKCIAFSAGVAVMALAIALTGGD